MAPFFIGLLSVLLGIVSVLIVLIVLMQRPKQEGLGAAFGGGMTDQMFGAQTTNVLQKGTVYLAVMFFVFALIISVLTAKSVRDDSDTIENLKEGTAAGAVEEPAPITPTPTPGAPNTATSKPVQIPTKPVTDPKPEKTDPEPSTTTPATGGEEKKEATTENEGGAEVEPEPATEPRAEGESSATEPVEKKTTEPVKETTEESGEVETPVSGGE